MKAIINAKVILKNEILDNGVVLIDDGKIFGIGNGTQVDTSCASEIIDADGLYVGPGFVDIHVHAAPDAPTYEKPAEAARYFLTHGETTILATPSYDMNYERFLFAIRTVKEYLSETENTNIRGMYMEGPYTNGRYGCNYDRYPWRNGLVEQEYKSLVNEAGAWAKVWTVAPEVSNLRDFLAYAREVNPNVKFAIGHSESNPEIISSVCEGFEPEIMTHIMDATGRISDFRGTRGAGPDEYCLLHDEMYAEMISDSCAAHVNKYLQQLVLKVKGVDKVILVSDRTTYNLEIPEHLKKFTDLNFDHNGDIAGSKLTLDVACRNIMKSTGCSIVDAFKMASTNPARAIGMSDVGSIEIGKRADLVFVDGDFNVNTVIFGGEKCIFN